MKRLGILALVTCLAVAPALRGQDSGGPRPPSHTATSSAAATPASGVATGVPAGAASPAASDPTVPDERMLRFLGALGGLGPATAGAPLAARGIVLPAPAAPGTPPVAPRDLRLSQVDLQDLPLREACRLLADAAGLNIVASAGAGEMLVSLYLRDVAALAAVESLALAHQLWFREDGATGILRIGTLDEYERSLAELQQEHTAYFTLLYPNVSDVGYAIRNLFGSRVVLRDNRGRDDVLDDLSDRLARFDLLDARTQGFGNGLGTGGSSGFGSGLGGSNDSGLGGLYGSSGQGGNQGSYGLDGSGYDAGFGPEPAAPEPAALSAAQIQALEQLAAAGGSLDALRAQLGSGALGLDRAPIHVTLARRQNQLIVRTADAAALDEIRTLVQRLDVPTALVLLEVRILSVDLFDGLSSFFEAQYASGRTSGEFTTGVIAGPVPPALGAGGTGLQGGNLIFQFVDSTFAARLQALERESRVRSLATPILLTANNEVSRLFVGREVPLNRSFGAGQVVSNESTTSTVSGTTGIEFRPVGTTLLITPNINADRTVTLKIVQESSNVDSTATILVPDGSDFTPRTIDVVSSQSVSGTIVAKSELAVAFGGLIETSVVSEEERVPILGSIPFLGRLFRRDVESESRREVVIVVRPWVLGTPADFESHDLRVGDELAGEGEPFAFRPDGAGARRLRFEVHGLEAGTP